jgi:hypothetical protein
MKLKVLLVILTICLSSSMLKRSRTKGGLSFLKSILDEKNYIIGDVFCTKKDDVAILNSSMQEISKMILPDKNAIQTILGGQTLCIYTSNGEVITKNFSEIESFVMKRKNWEIKLKHENYSSTIKSDIVLFQDAFLLESLRNFAPWSIYKWSKNELIKMPKFKKEILSPRLIELLTKNNLNIKQAEDLKDLIKFAGKVGSKNMGCVPLLANIDLAIFEHVKSIFSSKVKTSHELFLLTAEFDIYVQSFEKIGEIRSTFKEFAESNFMGTLFAIFNNSNSLEDLKLLKYIVGYNDIDKRKILIDILESIDTVERLKNIFTIIKYLESVDFVPVGISYDVLLRDLEKITPEQLQFFKNVDADVLESFNRYYNEFKKKAKAESFFNYLIAKAKTVRQMWFLERHKAKPHVLQLFNEIGFDIFYLINENYKKWGGNFQDYLSSLKEFIKRTEAKSLNIALQNPKWFVKREKLLFTLMGLWENFNSPFLRSLYRGEDREVITFKDFLLKFEMGYNFNPVTLHFDDSAYTLFKRDYKDLQKSYVIIKKYFKELYDNNIDPTYLNILFKYNEEDITKNIGIIEEYKKIWPYVGPQKKLKDYLIKLNDEEVNCLYGYIGNLKKSSLEKIKPALASQIKLNPSDLTIKDASDLLAETMKMDGDIFSFVNKIGQKEVKKLDTLETMLKNNASVSSLEALSSIYKLVKNIFNAFVLPLTTNLNT